MVAVFDGSNSDGAIERKEEVDGGGGRDKRHSAGDAPPSNRSGTNVRDGYDEISVGDRDSIFRHENHFHPNSRIDEWSSVQSD